MDTKPPVHHPGYPVGPPPTASPHIPPNSAPAPPHPSAGTPYMNGGSPLPSNAPPPQCKIEIILYTFNPKATRYLKVDLLHTFDHGSVVCCVKFSSDGRYLAAGCNQATYIYDTLAATRVA